MLTIDATNLPRVMKCNGSRLMPPAFPVQITDNTIRDEGNAVHWAASAMFHGDRTIGENTRAPNGVILTSEMITHVHEYLSSLDCGEMEVETSFGDGQSWHVAARCDHRKYNLSDDTLTIDDLKYGWRLVEVIGNWTLLAHAIGTCMGLGITPATIILRIHQPRPYHTDGKIREWRLTYQQLENYYGMIAATLSNPSDALNTGLDWCAKCHALATCPAAMKASMNAIDATTLAFNDDMPDAVAAYELDTLRTASAFIEARMNAVEEMVKYRVRNGAVIGDYALQSQYANRRFKPGVDPAMMKILTGIDLTKPGLVTPAEAERRGVDPKVIEAMTERPLTGVKLVRSTADKRARKQLNKE